MYRYLIAAVICAGIAVIVVHAPRYPGYFENTHVEVLEAKRTMDTMVGEYCKMLWFFIYGTLAHKTFP